METIIDRMKSALPCPLYANRTDDYGECAVYDVNTISYDGVKRRARIKVSIVANTMLRALEIEKKLDHALCTLGDCALSSTIKACERSGGGWLNDGDRHIRIAYYELIIKEEI